MLYKLTGQQDKAGFGGMMPAVGSLTTGAGGELCLFFDWVTSGAN